MFKILQHVLIILFKILQHVLIIMFGIIQHVLVIMFRILQQVLMIMFMILQQVLIIMFRILQHVLITMFKILQHVLIIMFNILQHVMVIMFRILQHVLLLMFRILQHVLIVTTNHVLDSCHPFLACYILLILKQLPFTEAIFMLLRFFCYWPLKYVLHTVVGDNKYGCFLSWLQCRRMFISHYVSMNYGVVQPLSAIVCLWTMV